MKLLKKDLKIKATSGKLIKDSDLFSYIDSDFKNWNLNEVKESKEINISVYEMNKNSTFKDIFESISTNLDSLAMTQGQIIEFCKNHKDELVKNYIRNFFLFKNNDDFFVAYVNFDRDGSLDVIVYKFSYGYVWLAGRRRRVVVRNLELSTLDPSDPLTLRPSDTSELDKAIELCKANGLTVTKTY